jgi:hypothetical protein
VAFVLVAFVLVAYSFFIDRDSYSFAAEKRPFPLKSEKPALRQAFLFHLGDEGCLEFHDS